MLCRLLERLRGLKGVRDLEAHAVLVPCRDIHTFGMEAPIDAAFVDATGTVFAVHRGVAPGRRIRHAKARMVVERRARAGRWFECGDRLFDMAFEEREKRFPCGSGGARGAEGGDGR